VRESPYYGNFQDAGHRAIVFIRFNPDEYTCKKNNLVLGSEWERDMRGQKDEGEGGRLTALKEQVDYWIEHRSDKMVETIQLYYDDEDGTDGDIYFFLFSEIKKCVRSIYYVKDA
jgi:hypothetical protein